MYVALGLTKQEVMESCPVEVEYVFEAQKLRKRMDDQANWELGMYVESAVATAVEHNLAGRKARSKYVNEPFSKKLEDSEKSNRKQLLQNNKLAFAAFETWARNWKLEHKKEGNDNG